MSHLVTLGDTLLDNELEGTWLSAYAFLVYFISLVNTIEHDIH